MIARLKALIASLKWSHVVFLVGAGAAFFYYTLDNSDLEQKTQSIASTKSNISTLERKIEEAKEFERQFEDKKRRYAELVKTMQGLKEALPRQFYLPDLLSDLQHETKQLEIEVTAIRPDRNEVPGELYNTIGFTIDARGTFLQLFVLFDRIAHMSRLLNVVNFSVTRDPSRPTLTLGGEDGAFSDSKLAGGNQTVTGVSTTFRVLTYRYRAPASTPASAEAAPAAAAAPAGGNK